MEAFIFLGKKKKIVLPFSAQDKKSSLCDDKRHIFSFSAHFAESKVNSDGYISHVPFFFQFKPFLQKIPN